MQYSELCDRNILAYALYLAAQVDGGVVEGSGRSVRIGEVAVDMGAAGVGSCFKRVLDTACGSERVQAMGGFVHGVVEGGDGIHVDEFVGTAGVGTGGCGGDSGVFGGGSVGCWSDGDDVGSGVEMCGRDGFETSVKGGKKNKPGKKMRDRLARKAAMKGNWRKKEDGGDTCVGEKDELRKSLEAKWAAENALASARAKHQLELLEKVDVDQVAKVQETKCKKAIEANMVAMEKAHAFLRSTGNVPGEAGFCQTVVSDDGVPELSSGSGSPVCTISPDSSASMKEFRECQKKLLDAEAELKKKDELLIKYGLGKYVKYGEKKTFTVGEDGRIPESVLDEVFPDGYIGEVMSDGKYRAVGMCVETGLPYTEDGSVLGKIEQIKEDRLYAGCN